MQRLAVALDERHAGLAARDQDGVDRDPRRGSRRQAASAASSLSARMPVNCASSSTLGVTSVAPAKIAASAFLGSTMTADAGAPRARDQPARSCRVEHALGIVGEHGDPRLAISAPAAAARTAAAIAGAIGVGLLGIDAEQLVPAAQDSAS